MATKTRTNTIVNLARLGIDYVDCVDLCRAERVLHTWGEHECNGVIQRDEITAIPYVHSACTGKRSHRTCDRETGALKRITKILAPYGLGFYHQTDPRGCALYIIRQNDVPPGESVDSYYTRGLAVCS